MTTNKVILQRRWNNLRKNMEHMEKLILELMRNPATEPEHMAQAHAMYANAAKQISEISASVDNALRGVAQPEPKPVYVCVCGCTEPPMKSIDHPDVWPSCPNCGMV
jgi:hypothetical protein